MCHEGGDKTMAQAFNCASTYGLEVLLVAAVTVKLVVVKNDFT